MSEDKVGERLEFIHRLKVILDVAVIDRRLSNQQQDTIKVTAGSGDGGLGQMLHTTVK